MNDDAKRLRRYAERGDEDAFKQIVADHFNLVYGTALRHLNGDAQLAQDVAQIVFVDLARKAHSLPSDIVLAGWLYNATRFASAKAVRSEQRRRSREQESLRMKFHENEKTLDWERLSPVLDAAMEKLSSKDRDAVLLHYFEQQSFRAVGSVLGLSDDATQKRVSRALVKLRAILIRSGMGVSISSLSSLLSTGALPPVPPDTASRVAGLSLRQVTAMGPQSSVEIFIQHFVAAKAWLTAAGLLLGLCCGLAYVIHDRNSTSAGKFTVIDISAYYNGRLDKSWTPVYGNNNDLAALGEGTRILKHVPFEIHGVIQLQGAEWKKRGYNFPENIVGIPVGKKGRRLHLLHADSAFAEPAGTAVAGLILHYSDGEESRFDIRQGIEILDWWDWPHAAISQPTDTNTVEAWSGSNSAAQQQGASIRLFDTAFVNPHLEKEIQSIDYTSAMTGSAPFMVALTIER